VSWYETAAPLQCFVQRLDASGAARFPAGGATATNGPVAGQQRVSPHVAFDPISHTTYMFYTETNTSQGASGIGCQSFDDEGNRNWGDTGLLLVPLGATGHTCTFARATLTAGGAIGTWFESNNSGVSHEVRSSKVDTANGEPVWANPILTVNNTGGAKSRLDVYAPPQGPTAMTYGDNSGTLNIVASRVNDDGTLGVGITCGTSDFNGDGDFGTDADIEAFFACLAGNCCVTCLPSGADFNGDGDVGTDADIEAFFRVLAGGTC
jgi:hypothetical protein